MTLPLILDDIYNPDLINFIRDKWAKELTYGWKSSGYAEHDSGHWNKQIIKKPNWINVDLTETPEYETVPEIQRVWNTLIGVIGEKRTLLRVYCNGYTYGTDGYTHLDYINTGGPATASETAIIYLNEGKWDMDWGGETIVYDDNEEPETIVKPKHGRLFLFNSQKWHRALPLSRAYGGLRTIITLKTYPTDFTSRQFTEAKRLCGNIPHRTLSGAGTLWHHSWYTARILESELKASKTVCMAGLFHANAYGTEHFPIEFQQSRDYMKTLLDAQTENLIYEWSLLPKNRNQVLLNREGNWSDRVYGRLIQLELANGLEQGTLQNGPQLYDILDTIKMKDPL